MLRKVVPILLVIIWIIVIFGFSSQEGEVSQSKSQALVDYLYKNYGTIVKDIDENFLHYLIRKTAHVTLYFVLCLVVMNALYFGGFRGKGLYGRVLIICFFYAAMDETHQRFISDRSGKLTDVFIDGIGIILGIGLAITVEKAYKYIKGIREEEY